MQKVDYRYSDSDFVSYLLTLGYKYTWIEVTNKPTGELRAFVHFNENKDELLENYKSYKDGNVRIDILEFSKFRRVLNKAIKLELSNWIRKD